MAEPDPVTCRRALREIGEIAAVAVLPDSQMTDRETLQSIASIAEWVRNEAPDSGADCGTVVQRISQMTASIDFEALDDRAVVDLFSRVLGALETAAPNAFGDGAVAPA